MNRIKTNQ